MQPRNIDAEYGIDTELPVEEADLGDFPGRVVSHRYYALRIQLFEEIMSLVTIAPEDWIFVDVGAGKGRVVLLASDYPFKQIIGVEFAPQLYDIMKNNLAIYNNPLQKCNNLQVDLADARYYKFPDHDLLFFSFNPMKSSALVEVFENIKRWREEYNRKALVLFVYPQLGNPAEEVIRNTGIFTVSDHELSVWRLLICTSGW